ncbi:uncharacterized protein LOC113147280 [Cyclospora cayetanensis]|uniref:Uncharacterized protein LOC113147280 n=1 Tax=Cyclospora cayetanensis TaxID=88456 RepID=A0A6P6S198_9EIME|nr:uncharacterized protein LOC113147280 [Cyclospora cayetanensis]
MPGEDIVIALHLVHCPPNPTAKHEVQTAYANPLPSLFVSSTSFESQLLPSSSMLETKWPRYKARQPPVSLCGGSKAERRQVAQAVASVILLRVFDGALRTLDALGSPKFMGQLETETSQHGPHVTAVKPPQQHMGSSRDHPGETTAQQSSFSSAESISRMTGGKPTAAISHSTTATAETTSAGHPPAGTTAGTQQQHVGPLGAPKHPSHPGALQRALQTTFAERVKSFFRQQQHSRVLHFLDGGPTAFGGIAASGSVRRPRAAADYNRRTEHPVEALDDQCAAAAKAAAAASDRVVSLFFTGVSSLCFVVETAKPLAVSSPAAAALEAPAGKAHEAWEHFAAGSPVAAHCVCASITALGSPSKVPSRATARGVAAVCPSAPAKARKQQRRGRP